MRKFFCTTLGLFFLLAASADAQTSADKRTIQVEINYTGSGTVNASHKIYIALWDSSDFSGGPPAAVESLDSKKGTVTFSNVQKVPAYVSAAYDPTGAWDAQSPPPSGSSLGMSTRILQTPSRLTLLLERPSRSVSPSTIPQESVSDPAAETLPCVATATRLRLISTSRVHSHPRVMATGPDRHGAWRFGADVTSDRE